LDDDDLYHMVEECMEMSRIWKLNQQPITYVEIAREQLKDKGMKYLRDKAPHLLGEVFEDIEKRSGADKVTTVKDPVTGQTRIAVPAKLTHRLISWYHNVLVLYLTSPPVLANGTCSQDACFTDSPSIEKIQHSKG